MQLFYRQFESFGKSTLLKSEFIFLKMTNNENIFKKVVAHCKEYSYIFQSSEIYDGLAAA